MGDRTYCQIEVARHHYDALEPIFDNWGFINEWNDEETVMFYDSEANYGGSGLIEELRKHEVPFVGSHEAGGNYGPAVFAFDGESYAECSALDGSPVCPILPTGKNLIRFRYLMRLSTGEC